MESTCLDLSKEAIEEYDTEMSLIIDEIIGSCEASKSVTTKNTLPVLVSTGNVERINNKRKPQYVKTISKKQKKMR